ncbi:MOSC domain-containing protein [Paenibacillus caseinilyticus]|uniref:Molybdenum cofactor biosysynthesis protein n=1 Tax=Paenibacillus mucilaginosus K02 TaxID=997761 RepID=I0BH96_9BACL|nr:MOSC domain-containing protein [Paenibacillus mucilaginosus]AFH61743.2 molybdenum cofactor biosysynthesis protein [Paenibacillus mucilaginosus K02]
MNVVQREADQQVVRGLVTAVSRSEGHTFSKRSEEQIRLVAGLGVEGDAHQGATVKHRSRVAQDPTQPNLRQVHLIHAELHDELRAKGYPVGAGEMGENVTTRGIDLLGLPAGTLLRIGSEAVIEVTGLRNPCPQLDRFMPGLKNQVLEQGPDGSLVRKAGIMAVVLAGGPIRPGDAITAELPPLPHRPLDRV